MVRNLSIIFVFVVTSMLYASGVPVNEMSKTTLGVEYKGVIAGQTITEAAVASTFKGQYCMLRYTPVSPMLFSLGIGANKFSTEEYDSTCFKGNAGLSVAAGITLYTPTIADIIMITASAEAYLINSGNSGYQYTALFSEERIGVRSQTGLFIDIEAGIKGHLLYGIMKEPDADAGVAFSNENVIRGYGLALLHTPGNSAYGTFGLDVSPKVRMSGIEEWYEMAFSVQVGVLIKRKWFANNNDKNANSTSGSYKEMKKKQHEMANELYKK